jgi:hypothetical protein
MLRVTLEVITPVRQLGADAEPLLLLVVKLGAWSLKLLMESSGFHVERPHFRIPHIPV